MFYSKHIYFPNILFLNLLIVVVQKFEFFSFFLDNTKIKLLILLAELKAFRSLQICLGSIIFPLFLICFYNLCLNFKGNSFISEQYYFSISSVITNHNRNLSFLQILVGLVFEIPRNIK